MKEYFEKLKKSKKAKLALILLLCSIMIIIYFVPEKSTKNEKTNINNNTAIEKTKEQQLEEVLCNIKGVGKVSVMITYQSGSEVVCANNIETQTNTVTEKSENGGIKESETIIENKSPVTVGSGDGENPLVIIEKEPEIKGVIVVAQGAENLNVKLNLQKAVETVLQVDPSQVDIFAMN
ncbi:MAG: hypothetical protein E7365_04675 [Clostridiales bacterium]|nr:hypothetical protein [Clostridiales bacterium]